MVGLAVGDAVAPLDDELAEVVVVELEGVLPALEKALAKLEPKGMDEWEADDDGDVVVGGVEDEGEGLDIRGACCVVFSGGGGGCVDVIIVVIDEPPMPLLMKSPMRVDVGWGLSRPSVTGAVAEGGREKSVPSTVMGFPPALRV